MIRWTDEALADFAGQISWAFDFSPGVADRLAEEVLASVALLSLFPRAGRVGRVAGTRELVLTRRPYLIIYTVRNESVLIVRSSTARDHGHPTNQQRTKCDAPASADT